MRNYNASKDYKNKAKKMEQELDSIKEQAIPVVAEAIFLPVQPPPASSFPFAFSPRPFIFYDSVPLLDIPCISEMHHRFLRIARNRNSR